MSYVIQSNKNPRLDCLKIVVGLIAFCLLASVAVTYLGSTSKRGNITIGISNCRQIITAMRIYSSDHGGKYPDAALASPRSSNEAFRVLFQTMAIDNELLFGCPMSPYVPDGDIGKAPDFKQALEAGENHWALTKGLSDSDLGSIPLMFENPSVATWPPKWNLDAKGTKTPGRSWSNGIIIGMNDSSVGIQMLGSKTGTEVPLKDLVNGDGENLFTQHGTDWTILNVESTPGAK
ncbi:hypothetical protein [Roseimicrobium sp. ORNL1]|uniref:hypothetical protein n=1 Tax=Roseimicrobium sp. ORNL1 TaxID=2711231 RepID=UPI0013E13930|nr:hypothetical protein [Roseimicrobium sp. ORNL1]QIF02572.1 hypothetical protein G5S37_13910 [Roseimicrobium sp. ORNL1]